MAGDAKTTWMGPALPIAKDNIALSFKHLNRFDHGWKFTKREKPGNVWKTDWPDHGGFFDNNTGREVADDCGGSQPVGESIHADINGHSKAGGGPVKRRMRVNLFRQSPLDLAGFGWTEIPAMQQAIW
jgi:hypothetical protein